MATDTEKASIPGDWAGSSGAQAALKKMLQLQAGAKQNDPGAAKEELGRYGDIFAQEFKQQVGRNPTSDEASRFFHDIVAPVGTFPGGEFKGIPDLMAETKNYVGNAFGSIAGPEREAALNRKAEDSYGQVGDLIKSTLGRQGTQDEIAHFAKLMADGHGDAYDLKQALQMLPEYQQSQDSSARERLRGELSGADQTYFEKNLMPSIQSQFAQSGRVANTGSDALAAAFANAGKDQNTAREQYLAQIGYQDYANSRQNTINQYVQAQQRGYQVADQNAMRGYQLQDQNTARVNDLADYQRQMAAYQQYLQKMGRRSGSSGMGSGIGTLLGTGLGAALAAPTGGMSIPMGAMLGGSLGGSAGGMFGSY